MSTNNPINNLNLEVNHSAAMNQSAENTATMTNEVLPPNPSQEPVVFFRAVSWLRDSHGLFDYESRNIVKMSLKTQSMGQIIRNEDQIDFNKIDYVIDKNNQPNANSLCLLKKDAEGYYLDHAVPEGVGEEESNDRLWLVARSLKNEQGKYDYKIQKFDAIKLGRVRFRVKDFRCDTIQMSEKELYHQELKEAMEVKGTKDLEYEGTPDQDAIQCRICWSGEDDATNPLILACKCKGTVGLIHFQCLKNWVLTQKTEKQPSAMNQNVRSFYWKRFECEICKQMYPYTFKIKETIYKIIDLSEITQSTQDNYILLESMPLDKNTSRNIHLLTVTQDQNEFKLGRGHESQVRINDISVSRCHAIIKCKSDGFYIEDNTSKFGTIVLLKNKLRLKAQHTMAVQVGRTVISFTIKYVQSERDKLKSDVSKVLEPKNKALKAQGKQNAFPGAPIQMQNTGYLQQNMPMKNDEDDDHFDNEPKMDINTD